MFMYVFGVISIFMQVVTNRMYGIKPFFFNICLFTIKQSFVWLKYYYTTHDNCIYAHFNRVHFHIAAAPQISSLRNTIREFLAKHLARTLKLIFFS